MPFYDSHLHQIKDFTLFLVFFIIFSTGTNSLSSSWVALLWTLNNLAHVVLQRVEVTTPQKVCGGNNLLTTKKGTRTQPKK